MALVQLALLCKELGLFLAGQVERNISPCDVFFWNGIKDIQLMDTIFTHTKYMIFFLNNKDSFIFCYKEN